MALETISQDWN